MLDIVFIICYTLVKEKKGDRKMKKYNFDNINEFFEELMNKPNAKINMLHVYGAYERDCERIKREQEIEDKYDCLGYNYKIGRAHV